MSRRSPLFAGFVSLMLCASGTSILVGCGSSQRVAEAPLPGETIVGVGVRLDQTVIADVDQDSVALIDVTAIQSPPNSRTSVHVALVLDTSGSMDGRRFENAVQAAHAFVDRLDSGDRLSIVSYGDSATTHLACEALSSNRSDAHEAIDAMVADGNTCVSCGLQAAYDAINGCRDSSVERVVLMSDGHANRGVADEQGLRYMVATARQYQGIETATIGLGRLHDEIRMAALAEAGAADYYFLHNSDYFAEVLEREVTDLHATAVTNVIVRLRGGDGVAIAATPMLGGSWVGEELIFDLGQMAVGEVRQLGVALSLPVGDPGRAITAHVDFLDAHGRVYRTTGTARIERSDDLAEIEESIDADVVQTFVELNAAAAVDEAMLQFEQGDRNAARETLESAKQSADNYAAAMPTPVALDYGGLETTATTVNEGSATYFEDERGEVLRQRAVNNDRRRGRPAPSPMYAPEALNLQELE